MAKTNHMRTPTPDGAIIWQLNYRRAVQASEALKRLHNARKVRSIDKDALWEGYYELRRAANRIVDEAHSYGRLLHCFYQD